MNYLSLNEIEKTILLIRGRKVLLSSFLATLYGVQPRSLIQAVKRNLERFPDEFMFQLSEDEMNSLRSQNVILENGGKGEHVKYLPYAFTQEGVAMLSSVLRSPRAIQANIAIMRTFIKLRELMISQQDLSQRIESLERRYDSQFKVVFKSIRQLIDANPKQLTRIPSKKKIGFGRD